MYTLQGLRSPSEDTRVSKAVIGHEIAHVKAEHGNERVSQNLVVQGGMAIAAVSFGQSEQTNQLIMAGLGVGILMPFSRAHEKEADLLGLDYLVKAGYDPNGAVRLWERMGALGGSPPEFLSTHPAAASRAEYLAQRIKAIRSQPSNTRCQKP